MRRLFFIAALGLATAAWAEDNNDSNASVNVDGGYRHERERATDAAAAGYGVGLTIGLDEHWSLGGNYSRLRTDRYTDLLTGTGRLQYTAIGGDLAVSIPLSVRTALSLSAGYVTSKTEGLEGFTSQPPESFHGPSGSLALSWRLFNGVMFSVGPAYSYIGAEPAWDGSATLGLRLAKWLWVDTNYWRSKVSDGWGVGLRTDFH